MRRQCAPAARILPRYRFSDGALLSESARRERLVD
jgi:hypothetical protein